MQRQRRRAVRRRHCAELIAAAAAVEAVADAAVGGDDRRQRWRREERREAARKRVLGQLLRLAWPGRCWRQVRVRLWEVALTQLVQPERQVQHALALQRVRVH